MRPIMRNGDYPAHSHLHLVIRIVFHATTHSSVNDKGRSCFEHPRIYGNTLKSIYHRYAGRLCGYIEPQSSYITNNEALDQRASPSSFSTEVNASSQIVNQNQPTSSLGGLAFTPFLDHRSDLRTSKIETSKSNVMSYLNWKTHHAYCLTLESSGCWVFASTLPPLLHWVRNDPPLLKWGIAF